MDESNRVPHRPDATLPELTDEERATYAWQFDVEGLGELGQRRLKGASVLISRIGGLGGMVALELAAAGVGRLILAHGGGIRPSDLNRQVLMTQDRIGTSRMDSAVARLRALNPRLEIVAEHANVSDETAHRLVAQADVVVDCAPLFVERYALNRAAIKITFTKSRRTHALSAPGFRLLPAPEPSLGHSLISCTFIAIVSIP